LATNPKGMSMRNLKTLGLALVAVLAMSALTASAASANPFFTSTSYPQTLATEDTGAEDLFTVSGNELTCSGETFSGTLTGKSTGISVTPNYINCKTKGAAFNNVTVTHNGCNFEFTVTTTINNHHHGGNVHIKCPVGKVIEIHHYSSQPHGSSSCTVTVGPQTVAGHPVTYTTDTAKKTILIEGVIPVAAQIHGACSFGITVNTTSEYHASTTAKAASGAAIHIGA
jgi:hypothetical protein